MPDIAAVIDLVYSLQKEASLSGYLNKVLRLSGKKPHRLDEAGARVLKRFEGFMGKEVQRARVLDPKQLAKQIEQFKKQPLSIREPGRVKILADRKKRFRYEAGTVLGKRVHEAGRAQQARQAAIHRSLASGVGAEVPKDLKAKIVQTLLSERSRAGKRAVGLRTAAAKLREAVASL